MEKTLLYRCPGPERAPGGHTYAWVGVETQAEYDELIQEGWSSSLMEAIERADMAKQAEEPELPANLSPEEKAAAAQKALKDAADKRLAAKRLLTADEERAKALAEALAEVEKRAAKAEATLADAKAEHDAAIKTLGAARNDWQLAEKSRKASALHAEATEAALNTAAGRVLTADKLLKAAKEKALAEAEAAEKALAEAEGKKGKTKKSEPKSESESESEPEDESPLTLEDVKAALTALKDTKAVKAILKKFGATSAPDLREDQYAEVIALAKGK